MELVLHDKNNLSIARKTLKTDSDFRRISEASLLVYKGSYFAFRGIYDGPMIIFQETGIPVVVDFFVEKI